MSIAEHSFHGVQNRWRWHYDTLTELRSQLVMERELGLAEAAQPLDLPGTNFADSGTDDFERGVALNRLSTEQEALYEVEAAIKRIEDGGYGICERTGKRIPLSRLRVVPWTRYCREAAEELESERSGKRRSTYENENSAETKHATKDPPG